MRCVSGAAEARRMKSRRYAQETYHVRHYPLATTILKIDHRSTHVVFSGGDHEERFRLKSRRYAQKT